MSTKDIGIVIEIMVMAVVISVILLFLGIGVLVLIHLCIVGRAIRTRLVTSSANQRGNTIGSTSMCQEDLKKLPCYDYIAKSKGSGPVDCAVCLDNFEAGDKCRLLPICKHSFHAQCVDAWLLKTPICPICRTTADARRTEPVVAQESSHFIETSIDVRGSHTIDSTNVSDARILLREGTAIATTSTPESTQSSETVIQISQGSGESTQTHDTVVSAQNQTSSVGT